MKYFYTILSYFLVITISYLIGSISFSRIIANRYGVDLTKVGSKNAGGTNVGRNISKKAGILTMILDMFKCYISLLTVFLIFNYLKDSMNIFTYDLFIEVLTLITAISVSLGHIYPIYYKFKGGKSVACFAGYILFISPSIFFIGMIVFFTLFKICKKVSLCSILTSLIVFVLSFIPMILDLTCLKDKNVFNGGTYFAPDCMIHLTYITTITFFIFLLLIVIKHLSNIKRLINGEEPDTVFKK